MIDHGLLSKFPTVDRQTVLRERCRKKRRSSFPEYLLKMVSRRSKGGLGGLEDQINSSSPPKTKKLSLKKKPKVCTTTVSADSAFAVYEMSWVTVCLFFRRMPSANCEKFSKRNPFVLVTEMTGSMISSRNLSRRKAKIRSKKRSRRSDRRSV